jgi:hypothetical protein
MSVVADTSPILYLVLIEQVELLQLLYGSWRMRWRRISCCLTTLVAAVRRVADT